MDEDVGIAREARTRAGVANVAEDRFDAGGMIQCEIECPNGVPLLDQAARQMRAEEAASAADRPQRHAPSLDRSRPKIVP